MVFFIARDSETVGAAEANTLDGSVLCIDCVGFALDGDELKKEQEITTVSWHPKINWTG